MSAWWRNFSSRGRGTVIIGVSIVATVVTIIGLLVIVDELSKSEPLVVPQTSMDLRALERQERAEWDRKFEEAEARRAQWERELEERRRKQQQRVEQIAPDQPDQ